MYSWMVLQHQLCIRFSANWYEFGVEMEKWNKDKRKESLFNLQLLCHLANQSDKYYMNLNVSFIPYLFLMWWSWLIWQKDGSITNLNWATDASSVVNNRTRWRRWKEKWVWGNMKSIKNCRSNEIIYVLLCIWSTMFTILDPNTIFF